MKSVLFSRFDYNFFGVEHNSLNECSNFGVSMIFLIKVDSSTSITFNYAAYRHLTNYHIS